MRIKQLDLLRGIAILMVLGRHPVVMPAEAGVFQPFAALWHRIGWTGVDLFFVLSGFLIGGLLFAEIKKTGKLDVRRFLIRRIFKIWPAYYVLVIFMLLFVPMAIEPGKPLSFSDKFVELLPHFTHTQNYLGEIGLHTWSLAIEEHFYLFLPFVLLLLIRPRAESQRLFASVVTLTILLASVCLILRIITPADEFSDKLNPTHLRIDSLFFGVFLAAIYHLKPSLFAVLSRYRKTLVFVGLLLISPMMVIPIENLGFVETWGFSLLYLGYGCLLIAAVSSSDRVTEPVFARALIAVGIPSYSVYLWHWHISLVIKTLVAKLSPWAASLKWILFTSIYILAAVFLGRLMNHLIEVPALKLRERLFPSKVESPKAEPNVGRESYPIDSEPTLIRS